MLVGAKIDFIIVVSEDEYLEADDNVVIAETEKYICISNGEEFFVVFKYYVNNQVLVISPDFTRNLDPDGGTSFIKNEVISFIEALVSNKTYM